MQQHARQPHHFQKALDEAVEQRSRGAEQAEENANREADRPECVRYERAPRDGHLRVVTRNSVDGVFRRISATRYVFEASPQRPGEQEDKGRPVNIGRWFSGKIRYGECTSGVEAPPVQVVAPDSNSEDDGEGLEGLVAYVPCCRRRRPKLPFPGQNDLLAKCHEAVAYHEDEAGFVEPWRYRLWLGWGIVVLVVHVRVDGE